MEEREEERGKAGCKLTAGLDKKPKNLGKRRRERKSGL
jgi:hypothetical protein